MEWIRKLLRLAWRIAIDFFTKLFQFKSKKMEKKQFIIAIPVYDGVDLMDIAAPREMFTWPSSDWMELKVYFIGEKDPSGQFPAAPIKTRDGTTLIPDVNYEDEIIQTPNLIWVPGGAPSALSEMINDPDCLLTNYVKEKGEEVEWLTSVCEGAILLASTKLLDGYKATTHHSFYPCMEAYPEVKMVQGYPRYVRDRNRITGGGISSGLDEALFIIELIMGKEQAQSVQQVMQYYPKPPVHSQIIPSDCCPVSGMIDNTCA